MVTDVRSRLGISERDLAEFCAKWKIARLEVFGSALRDDFDDESDIDLLYVDAPGADWTVFDHVHAEEELGQLVGRKVDLVSREAIEKSRNWIRRKAILESAQPIYG